MAAAAVSPKAMPNTRKTYEVSRADLPVSCPLPDMMVWNSHPKVYLPIEATGKKLRASFGWTQEDSDYKDGSAAR